MTSPLHEDHPRGRAVNPDGKLIRNLSAEDYDALYDQGEPCHAEHADLIAQAEVELDDPFADSGPMTAKEKIIVMSRERAPLPNSVPPWTEGDDDSE